MPKPIALLACALTLVAASAHAARDTISIVGSSTVYPFSKVVAERLGQKSKFKAPKVEPTGTGGGFKEFCGGVGVSYADIANASRKIKDSEVAACQQNGVKDIIEVLFGYDGIVVANSIEAPALDLSLKDLYLSLAKFVPDPKNPEKLIENPYKTWRDVNAKLPDMPISVMGPPPTSGTRDAFVELAMEGGCKKLPTIAALEESDKDKFKAVCHGIREDGVYVEAGENDNLIVRKLAEDHGRLGIFGFSFLDQNADKVQASKIDGQPATFESIADGSYIISRPLYFYVKKAHLGVIPGLDQYMAEFTSERAFGEDGYLADKGMIPLDAKERKAVAQRVKNLETMAN